MGLSKGFGSTPSRVVVGDHTVLARVSSRPAKPRGGWGTTLAPQAVAFPNPYFEASGGGGKRYARHAATLVAPADTGIGKHKEARPLTATTRAKQLRSPNSPNSRSADVTSCRSGGWQASVWCL